MLRTQDDINLDIIIDKAQNEKKIILVWPWVGGNTRVFMLPIKKFINMGYSIIQYNPRRHANSGGQISMKVIINDLYYILHKYKLLSAPIIGVGHSAGASALLRLNHKLLNIEKLFLVEPGLDFRGSICHMYKTGSHHEMIDNLVKYSKNPDSLSEILNDDKWLDLHHWHQNNLKSHINTLCDPFNAGDFLEDFYMPGHNTIADYSFHRDIIHTYISTHDTWFPVQRLQEISQQNNVSYSVVEKAKDHYFYFAWNNVWDSILEKLNAL